MARRVLPLAAGAALVFAVAGCSNYERPHRQAWRGQAEQACIAQKLVHVSAFVQPSHEIDGPGICGLDHPFKVTALQDGAVAFNSSYTLDCPMIAALDGWLAEVVQPIAQARFGQPVVEIDSMGAYSCRGMNGQYGAPISEHAFGNAIDIGGFRLADGRRITVVHDWTQGDDQTQAFLREVHAGACSHFTTVLGPGYNAFHYNHIHVDLAMRGNTSTGPRRVCRPTPQLNGMPAAAPRDTLPDPPNIDDDMDISQAEPAIGLHPGPGPGPVASVPAQSYATAPSSARAYSPMPPQPTHGTLRDDGAFVPEGNPRDWDATSSIPKPATPLPRQLATSGPRLEGPN
jgi:hypothetical protein